MIPGVRSGPNWVSTGVILGLSRVSVGSLWVLGGSVPGTEGRVPGTRVGTFVAFQGGV